MAFASRNFNAKQALEREIKDLYAKIGVGAPAYPTAEFATTEPVVLTHATLDDAPNGGTVTLQVAAAAANPTDTVLAAVTGTAGAMVITITPNSGANNPDAAAEAVLDLTADITLTSVAAGTGRNTNTFTLQVLAAAPNTGDEVLVAFTGTAAAIVCTVTPNDGTNNAATPVDLTTAELVELINTGAVAAFSGTIVLTDASSRRVLQTAAGGGATALADAGEGDGVIATFSGGTDEAVDLTTEELAELIDSGTVAAKTVTLTDAGSLLDLIASATGGDSEPLADAGEGDGEVATWASGADNITDESVDGCGVASIARNGVGDYTITLSEAYYALKSFDALVLHATAADHTFQVKSEAVSDSSSKQIRFLCLSAGVVADPADGSKILCKIVLKNSSAPW
jgi:hypothetical protein